MAAIPFQIELVMAPRGYVLARALEERSFELVEGTRLGGFPVEPRYLDVPRAMSPDGTPRLDIYAFLLKHREHAARFKPGDRVELTEWREPQRLPT
jgi:hypothetical protein